MKALRRPLDAVDFAYACFGALGLAALVLGEGPRVGLSAELAGAVLMLIAIPCMLALAFSTVLAYWHWRHTPLLVLGIINTIFWATFLSDPRDNPPYLDIAGGIYVAAIILIPAWWFAVGRRRNVPGTAHPAI